MFHYLSYRILFRALSVPLVIAPFLIGPTVAIAAEEVKPDLTALDEEKSKQADAILTLANKGNEKTLRSVDFPDEVIKKIMAHREAGKTYTDLSAFQKQTGIDWAKLRSIMQAYDEVQKKPVAVTTSREEKMKSLGMVSSTPGEQSPPEETSTPSADSEGPFSEVRAGYFGQLPGYEHIHKGDPLVKQEFLAIVNRELCQCGCQNETLAFCLVNDPGCPIVKARVKKVYEDIMKKAAAAEAAQPR